MNECRPVFRDDNEAIHVHFRAVAILSDAERYLKM
jgi:hypothetical protein